MMFVIWLLAIALFTILLYMRHNKYHHHHPHEEGSFTVTGSGHHHIHLHRHPRQIEVDFCDSEESAGCHVGRDSVKWEIKDLLGIPTLEIVWRVGGAREITWKVKY